MDLFDASLFKKLFEFVSGVGGPALNVTPLEAAIVNNKQFLTVST